ncbi:MAG: hypothetical protein KME64_26075 [Scytonematopsis contorta HA4267-MV1]|nr:hypothetical protein [Scytonematopsis contorta HA4267-MV1]
MGSGEWEIGNWELGVKSHEFLAFSFFSASSPSSPPFPTPHSPLPLRNSHIPDLPNSQRIGKKFLFEAIKLMRILGTWCMLIVGA